MNQPIDLRSDTLTKPTPGMIEAMMKARVGDDVFGEDPTVIALQEKAAEMLGKPAALFVPSGTMANQVSIKVSTNPGDEVILEAGAHPFMYEGGAAPIISAVQFRTLPGVRGILEPEQVAAVIRPPADVHHPPSRLICLENTHNGGGGTIYPLEKIAAIRGLADRFGLAMHMDGARLFNACVASGVKPPEYARYFDTVSFCLSKGLGAPVGSLIVADHDRIARARRWRKVLGGGMRQAGFLAAAGLYALENNVDRLAEDHENARKLAEGLSGIDGLEVNPAEVDTNIVMFRVVRPGMNPAEFCAGLKAKGVLVLPFGPDRVRAVTHLDLDPAGIPRAIEAAASVMAG